MTKKTVAEIIKEASEAAKLAPEHLQEVAFSKAFDALSGGISEATAATPSDNKRKKVNSKSSSKKKTGSGVQLDALDRTAHPEIGHERTGLDNSLLLLRAAKNDLEIDGLSAAEIARVLTEKFRAKISRQAVHIALNDAGRYVNRRKEGSSVVFQLMGPGESYLDAPRESGVKTPAKGKKNSKKATSKPKVAKKSKKSVKKSSSKSKAKGRIGADAAFRTLYNNDFFTKGRTIGDITDELKHSHGRAFKSNEMSPVLLRYLRNGDLKREKNKDKQYEYSKP